MPKLRVADINIHYEMYGHGEPLVLIMGLGGGSSMWWQQVAFFAPEYQVITYDSRGVGDSDKPDMPYSMHMLAEDAAGLLEKLGICSTHVYGVSMGGMVAQELALGYPSLVTSLTLGATTCGGAHMVAASEETLQRLFSIMTLPVDEAVKVSTSATFSAAFIERHPEKIREWLIKGAESPPTPLGFKRQAEAATGFDTYDRLAQIAAPTLILAGTRDDLIPVENSRILASRIPNAELVLFEGAGHGYLWEAEEQANRVIRDFLRRHPISRPSSSEPSGVAEIPAIDAGRFILRPYREGDEDSLIENINNIEIARSTLRIPHPYTKRDACFWIDHNLRLGMLKDRSEIHFAIDMNGRVIGGIGLEKIDGCQAEIGYWLGETYWGQGIMTSAVHLVTGYAFDELGLGKVCAYVFPSNEASMRVLRKAGYRFEGRLTSHYSKEGKPVDAMMFTNQHP
ncbi:MAG: hypothetical protein A2Y72_02905 [Chloroflexi bacterium RBG_13_53_26]|nr:MAG: hypothetical protein A2Y72_02905 [Chloroflexi bacterium RBG_13_53_26]